MVGVRHDSALRVVHRGSGTPITWQPNGFGRNLAPPLTTPGHYRADAGPHDANPQVPVGVAIHSTNPRPSTTRFQAAWLMPTVLGPISHDIHSAATGPGSKVLNVLVRCPVQRAERLRTFKGAISRMERSDPRQLVGDLSRSSAVTCRARRRGLD